MLFNPVKAMLGRKLRLAVIGGGSGSFIGEIHRIASRLDDRYDIVTGIFSSDPQKSKKSALDLGIAKDRVYSSTEKMLAGEMKRDDGADVVAIMTPNNSHYDLSMSALNKGFDVICDKPMTNTVREARQLHAKVMDSGLVFCLTHNYTGYPMVRQAKAMVKEGELGTIRLVQVEYVQGGNAKEKAPDPSGDIPWRQDPKLGGSSLVLGDIGSHAHNLVRFITEIEVTELAAEVGNIVPGRMVHDYAGAMLRFSNGARGSFWVTQAAAGVENCLRTRISGTRGTLEWMQEIPQQLIFKSISDPVQVRTPGGPGTYPFAKRATRVVAGHPEGFPEGFANIYSDAAEAIAARRSDKKADPLSQFFPNSGDGLSGVLFIDAALKSSRANGKWITVEGHYL